MANTTINAITIHDGINNLISDNTCRKESTLSVLPLYLSDSDATDVFDFGGTVKTITLTGIRIDTSVANLKTWVDSIEALQQGHQDVDAGAPYVFVDDLRGTINVKVIDFSTTWNEGDPSKVSWTLKLVQSSTNA